MLCMELWPHHMITGFIHLCCSPSSTCFFLLCAEDASVTALSLFGSDDTPGELASRDFLFTRSFILIGGFFCCSSNSAFGCAAVETSGLTVFSPVVSVMGFCAFRTGDFDLSRSSVKTTSKHICWRFNLLR